MSATDSMAEADRIVIKKTPEKPANYEVHVDDSDGFVAFTSYGEMLSFIGKEYSESEPEIVFEGSDDEGVEEWFEKRRDVLMEYLKRYGGPDNTHKEAKLEGYIDGLREGKRLADGNPPSVEKPPYADLLPEGVEVTDWQCTHCEEIQMSIDKPEPSTCQWCGEFTEWTKNDEA